MRRAMLLAALPALAPLSAAAAPAAKTAAAAKPAAGAGPKRYGDFIVRCASSKSVAPCDMYEERANKDTNQRVIGFSIGYMPSASRYIIQVAVPLGIDIQKGATISDGALTSPALPFRRCDQNGCYVEGAADKSLLELFAKMGASARVSVTSYDGTGNGKVYPFTFSFTGFTDGMSAMVAENKAMAVSPDAASDAH